MKIISERAKEIDAYISSHKEMGRWPLEIAGEKNILPFYRFPIRLLKYNVKNGRLTMERRDWEVNNGRNLDSLDKDDAKIIRDLLLALNEKETQDLRNDLLKMGQMEPGVITNDGFVINGNRRLAVIEDLHCNRDSSGKWECLEAVRLPENISEKDLWKIEAGLQLSKDKVAEYHPVNELLKIKEGIDALLNPKEIAAAMYGRSEEYVKDALDRLNLIDDFLIFFKQRGNYNLIKKFRYHEYFLDIQKYVLKPGRRVGLPKRELAKRLENTFALLRANVLIKPDGEQKGITHWDIRKFGKIFEDAQAESAYLEHLGKVKRMHDIQPKIVIEDFENAVEEIRFKEQRDEPLKLVEKAIKSLERIDKKSKHFKERSVLEAITKLFNLIHGIREELLRYFRK